MKRLFIKKNNATAVTGYMDHLIVNVLFAAVVVSALMMYRNRYAFEFFGGMALSTLFMSPDMDSNQAVCYKNWWILRAFWWPYTQIFSHRGRDYNLVFNTNRGIGHNLILGTAFRLIYASLLLSLIGIFFPGILTWVKGNWAAVRHIGYGVWIADGCHILVDGLVHRN